MALFETPPFVPSQGGGLLGGDVSGLLGGNPLLNIGLGILANNTGNYGRAGPAIGRGFQQGIAQSQQALAQAAAQKMMKAQMDEMEEERKRRRGTTEALSKAYTPAGNMANMSFMDANNAAMAGENPDFQINQTPASFDINRALPEIMQVNPELGMQLYQQEQERQRQAGFQNMISSALSDNQSGGSNWQNLANAGAIGSLGGVKGASSLIELAKLNKPDPSIDLAAAKYFDETGQYPPGYVPPQMRGQQTQPTQPQSGNLPTNNFGMPVSWSGADFGAPGTTQTDIAEGVRSDADVALLDPRKGRPVTGPLVTPMPEGLSPAQQRQFRLDEAKAQIQTPKDKADLDKLNREKEEAERKQAEKNQFKQSTAKGVIDAIDGVIKRIDGWSAGAGGKIMRNLPINSTAFDVASDIDTIKSNFGFDRLQAMRDMSPTGGALGQVAVQELTMLQATVANLDPNQSPTQLKRNLEKARTHYENWLKTVEGGEQNIMDKNEPMPSGKKPPMKGQVKNGWKFMGGDPADPNSWRKQ